MTFSYRFVIIAAFFITCLLTANILIVKQISIGGLVLPAAIIIFPLNYIFGDVLTEVYGYKQARFIIWIGFACNLLTVLAFWIGGLLPPAPIFDAQSSYDRILGSTPRFLLASFFAYLVGELHTCKDEGCHQGALAMVQDNRFNNSRPGVGHTDSSYYSLCRFDSPLRAGCNDAQPLAAKNDVRSYCHTFHIYAGKLFETQRKLRYL
jgi:hypothetical protein